MSTPYIAQQLKLSARYREQMETILLSNVEDAIAASSTRDDDLADSDDLLEGREIGGLPMPWDGACDLMDVLPREQHTTLLANLMFGLYREKLAMVAATDAAQKDGAAKTETFIADRWAVEGYAEAYAMKLSNMLRDKAGVLYGGYCERKQTKRVHRYAEFDTEAEWFRYWNEETGAPDDLIEPEDRAEGKSYAMLPATIEERHQGAEYRAVDLGDFYLFPANARSIEAATLTLERMLLSVDDLIEGITRYGYDKAAVEEMIRLGPTHLSAAQNFREVTNNGSETKSEREDAIGGVTGATQHSENGVYECFLGFGRLPKIFDAEGQSLLPKDLWAQECTFMICPGNSIVFRVDASPYPWKPYTMQSLYPKNGRAYGSGMMDVLAPLAREATYWTRQTFNSIEQEMMPERVMTDEAWERNRNRELWPGKVWREQQPGQIRFLDKGSNSLMGMQPLADVRNRANTLFAAQGAGELQTKVRKNAEIMDTMQKADAKAQLYTFWAFRDIAEDARRRVEMELIFNPDYAGQVNTSDGEVQITANDLRGSYRYTVAQVDADSSPQAQQQKKATMLTIQGAFFANLLKFPMFTEQIWNGARQALLDFDREPEKLIGTLEEAKKFAQSAMAPAPTPGGLPLPSTGGLPGGMSGGLPGMNGGMPLPPIPLGLSNGVGSV